MALLGAAALWLEAALRPVELAEAQVPAEQGYLRGRVSESTGLIPFMLPGIPGARASLVPGNHETSAGEDGRFTIAGIPAGVYTLTLAADGFETTVLENIAVPGGAITDLPEQALFPAVRGAPVARLKLASLAPFVEPPAEYPYLTTVYLDATDSENISPTGIRFEILDSTGALLRDPYSPDGAALQPARSAIPGTSPALFLFEPPQPDDYTVRLILTNDAAPATESIAEVTLSAVNSPPVALPRVIAGPQPPRKTPDDEPRVSTGLSIVRTGDPVFLMGLGLDRNHASPERYNPGGTAPDAYGKNHDHWQRQFGFSWQLQYRSKAGDAGTNASHLLRGPDGNPATRGQLLHFTAEQAGRYDASLVVDDRDPAGALSSASAALSILVLDEERTADPTVCAGCHQERFDQYARSSHAGLGCDNCHGPAAAHLAVAVDSDDYERRKRETQEINLEAGLCGWCHREYAEWEKSRHADGTPYGHLEIARPLLVQCSKCHYAKSFASTVALARDRGVAFHDIDYKIRAAGIGPLMADLSKVPAPGDTGISCTTCHDPHATAPGRSAGLRTASAGELCQTCHEEKWQNAVLEATAAAIHNGYEYPGQDYGRPNPHLTSAKCVRCHLDKRSVAFDARGVRAVGGHTLRMRDAGPNGALEGAGTAGDGDDILHLAPCQDCHRDLATFDRGGLQSDIHARWARLGDLLRSANGGVLPGVKPGDKCATCHRGGTLPFDNDPDLVLESAYLNYKLIRNDRSWGIHNPPYVRKLLDDSIAAVETWLDTRANN